MLENYINGWTDRSVQSQRTSVEWRNKQARMANTNGNTNHAQLRVNIKGGHNTWIDQLDSKCDVQT
jgi:hypothetical protein